MTRFALTAFVMLAVDAVGVASASPAEPRIGVADAPGPCVNREDHWWRPARDPIVDAKSLHYCTGADCWTLDLASNTIAAALSRPETRPRRDRQGEFSDGHGTLLASASETQVSFCPGGDGTCKVFSYKFDNRAVNGVSVMLNEERTLGAVIYQGESEIDDPSYVLAYDLVKMKPIAKVQAHDVSVLGHGFLINDKVLYSAAWKKVGVLAAYDQAWERIGRTNLLAIHDTKNGTFVIQDAATGKVTARIAHGLENKQASFLFVASLDGARLYAIGTVSDEGEVVTIDVAAGKIVSRATPPPCPAGTHRLQQ